PVRTVIAAVELLAGGREILVVALERAGGDVRGLLATNAYVADLQVATQVATQVVTEVVAERARRGALTGNERVVQFHVEGRFRGTLTEDGLIGGELFGGAASRGEGVGRALIGAERFGGGGVRGVRSVGGIRGVRGVSSVSSVG